MRQYRVRRMRPSEREETGHLMDDLGFGPGKFPSGLVIVAVLDNVVVGFGVLVRKGDIGVLTMAGVHPNHRGQGLQRRLIQYRLKIARKACLPRVRTFVYEGNHYSMNNLIHCGFRVDRQLVRGRIRFVRHLQRKEN